LLLRVNLVVADSPAAEAAEAVEDNLAARRIVVSDNRQFDTAVLRTIFLIGIRIFRHSFAHALLS